HAVAPHRCALRRFRGDDTKIKGDCGARLGMLLDEVRQDLQPIDLFRNHHICPCCHTVNTCDETLFRRRPWRNLACGRTSNRARVTSGGTGSDGPALTAQTTRGHSPWFHPFASRSSLSPCSDCLSAHRPPRSSPSRAQPRPITRSCS